jgi:hypothetical protein
VTLTARPQLVSRNVASKESTVLPCGSGGDVVCGKAVDVVCVPAVVLGNGEVEEEAGYCGWI